MEDSLMQDARRDKFSAFISYSHADSKRVRKIHARLESYRLPKGLRPIVPANSAPGGVGRVFQDRSDLSASESLSASIKQALDCSEALIVMCSPNSRNSRWVGQEIAYFREENPRKPILAAVLEGEPKDVFPTGLLALEDEPLAADFRNEGDGPRLALLKLISGIAQVPLDSLIQRDSQRKLRRVMVITGIAALVALSQLVMTAIAIDARNEAQFQQTKAENLIEFMLTDLRNGLESVGRLELMENVNRRALDYYDAQGDPAELSDESLMRRTRIINLVGVDHDRREDYINARRNFAEYVAVTKELLEREPSDPRRVLAHASAKSQAMTSPSADLSQEEVRPQTSGILADLDSIREWGNEDTEWLELQALASSNQCVFGLQTQDFGDSMKGHCLRSVQASEKLALPAPDPEAVYVLTYNAFWYAMWLDGAGDRDGAAAVFEEAIAHSTKLVRAHPESNKYLRQRMELLGATPRHNSRFAANLCEAASIAMELSEFDPANAELQTRRKAYAIKMGEANVQCL